MTLTELKKLAKECDLSLEKLETAKKWGSPAHIKKAQEELDNILAMYDNAEQSMKG